MPSLRTPFVRMIDRFPEVMITGDSRTAAAVEKAAADIETGAKARSRVDTGNMRNGWTTERKAPHVAVVYNPVYYTIFNEYGTVHMSAQPMLEPAVEEVTPDFVAAVRRAWQGV